MLIEMILALISFPIYLVCESVIRFIRRDKKKCPEATEHFLKLFLIFYLFTYGAMIFILGG